MTAFSRWIKIDLNAQILTTIQKEKLKTFISCDSVSAGIPNSGTKILVINIGRHTVTSIISNNNRHTYECICVSSRRFNRSILTQKKASHA